MKKKFIIFSFIGLLITVALLVYWGQWKIKQSENYYSGTIEAKESRIAFQISGRVTFVHAKEGEFVTKDQTLAEIDTSEIQTWCDQSKANLERVTKTYQYLEQLLRIYSTTLPAEVTRATAALEAAKKTEEDALRNKNRYESLFVQQIVSEKDRDAVRLHAETASARRMEAEAILHTALGNLGKIDATKKEIEATKAQINQAKAMVDQCKLQLSYAKLKAPFDGVITSRNVEPGEVVNPSREVFTIADLRNVELKIFVEETNIGKVKPGQPVDVKVDTFPDKVYRGTVVFVSPEGEFTPKIIQTKKERVKLVYLVKISIPNPHLELKTGMPADAWLR
ncbi:MAG: HlyD family efflux transporter periplasmic adaptor subunit [Syntrophales bacterium]|nr:HlyD family efflux transporter periplasmic adaptor subunit [Syntrophales bacterium]